MNAYGARAMDYMRLHRPTALVAIPEPEAYFTDLGEQILAQVLEVEEALAGQAPPGEAFVDRLGRLKMARLMAEERVLAELVYSNWEEEGDEPPMDETGAYVGGQPGWEPLIPLDLHDDPE